MATTKELKTQLADAQQEALDNKRLVQELKGELNKLKTATGTTVVDLDSLINKTYGFVRLEKNYYQVTVKFDADLTAATITEKKPLGSNFAIATGKIRKDFALDVLDKARKS